MSSAIDNEPHAQASQCAGAEARCKNDKNKNDGGTPGSVDAFMRLLDAYRTHGVVKVDGDEGDDEITAEGWAVSADGGDGNDTLDLSGYYIHAKGGQGDDKINVSAPTLPEGYFHDPRHLIQHPMHPESHHPHAHHHPYMAARVYGGQGDDTIKGAGFTWAWGGDGSDDITVGGGRAIGGSGDDVLTNTGGRVELYGGAGNDTLKSTGKMSVNSRLFGGAGDDTIHASGTHALVHGGTGDDEMTLDGTDDTGVWHFSSEHGIHPVSEGRSELQGGVGDDGMTLINGAEAIIRYNAGDGHDVLQGARETSTLAFGSDLNLHDAVFSTAGDDLTVAFPKHDGSVTFKNYMDSGVPMMEFSDGTIVDASTAIHYAGGDADQYRADDDPEGGVTTTSPSGGDD